MTNEQNAKIAVALAGYEVQVSPAGKWYVVTGDETKPMPDYEVDSAETLSTAQAICKMKKWGWKMGRMRKRNGYASVGAYTSEQADPLSALAHCLLKIAEGE